MIPLEFLNAFKAGHTPATRDFIDEELSWKLLDRIIRENCEESRKTLRFLAKFNMEFYQNFIKKHDPSSLHNTDELRRDCYSRENSRNRDVATIYHKIDFLYKDKPQRGCDHEDAVIKIIDFLKEYKKATKN